MSQASYDARSERGFTLVELMVVVAIIALLAAIIIPNYVHSRASAAVAQSEANLKQIATALELYRTDNQQYPPANGLVTPALFAPPGGGTSTGVNPYLTATPYNALGHQQYTYTFVAGAGNSQATETYRVDDPGIYDASTMNSVPTAAGAAGAGGTLCQNNCTQLHYTPQDGIYGTP
ncbi:MAG: prepilin-type N-terminal cleavage/methylation domain-containing protein [Candidatus Eremiobacteraeota bacterium]|nr:prepilin-type N-terminal cleavage/methylation domain-containing protein [Candidatus Eremiobacteraeota bacterium]MBC5821130.1 prepilin-type N-terminal cleavage/methylation domain-containing protein [Candidatus Eremiobacteraeota bacterium]